MNNRASAGKNRKKFDQYFTPRWAVAALLNYVDVPEDALIGEPCAGAGHIVEALRNHGYCSVASEIDPTVEPIADDLGIEYGIDFLGDHDRYASCDWIITNPPYHCRSGTAAKCFKKATEIAPNVAMLMRLGWLEACQDRAGILPQLSQILILPRVQFIGAGGSGNSSPSVWCVWNRDRVGGPTRVTWADRSLCRQLKREYA